MSQVIDRLILHDRDDLSVHSILSKIQGDFAYGPIEAGFLPSGYSMSSNHDWIFNTAFPLLTAPLESFLFSEAHAQPSSFEPQLSSNLFPAQHLTDTMCLPIPPPDLDHVSRKAEIVTGIDAITASLANAHLVDSGREQAVGSDMEQLTSRFQLLSAGNSKNTKLTINKLQPRNLGLKADVAGRQGVGALRKKKLEAIKMAAEMRKHASKLELTQPSASKKTHCPAQSTYRRSSLPMSDGFALTSASTFSLSTFSAIKSLEPKAATPRPTWEQIDCNPLGQRKEKRATTHELLRRSKVSSGGVDGLSQTNDCSKVPAENLMLQAEEFLRNIARTLPAQPDGSSGTARRTRRTQRARAAPY